MATNYKIIFHGQDFLVVDKPAGWLTVPGRQNEADPRPCLGRQLEADLSVRVFPVHRLDLEVSGLVLFALAPESHRRACGWFESHRVRKVYEGISEHGLTTAPAEPTIWRSQLVRGKKRAFAAPHGKPSETVVRCLGPMAVPAGRSSSAPEVLSWHLEPVTGRSHQLRFEMAHHGWPLLGDTLYGSKVNWPAAGIALRAVRLDLTRLSEGERGELAAEICTQSLASYVAEEAEQAKVLS